MEDIARDTSPRFVPNILGRSCYTGCCKSAVILLDIPFSAKLCQFQLFFVFLSFFKLLFPSVFVFLVSRLPHTSSNPYRDQAWHTQSLKTGRWICNANNAHCAHSACAMFNADNAHNDIKAQCTVPNAQCPMFNFQCPIPNAKLKTLCSQYLNQCPKSYNSNAYVKIVMFRIVT